MLFDEMYLPDKRDAAIFGDAYTPPADFRLHNRGWFKVATYWKEEDGDGQTCEVYEMRLPARFFKLVALPSVNSVGDPMEGWALSTGSGDDMGKLMVQLAKAVVRGMVCYVSE